MRQDIITGNKIYETIDKKYDRLAELYDAIASISVDSVAHSLLSQEAEKEEAEVERLLNVQYVVKH